MRTATIKHAPDLARFASALRRQRKKRKLTQDELGRAVGLKNGRLISNIEHERCWPGIEVYVSICRALKLKDIPLFPL